MAKVIVTCRCGKKLQADSSLVGQQAKCPACGSTLVIAPQEVVGTTQPGLQDQERPAPQNLQRPASSTRIVPDVLVFRGRPTVEVAKAGLLNVDLPRSRGKSKQVLQALQDEARRSGFNAVYGVYMERAADRVTATATGVQMQDLAYRAEHLRWALVRLSHTLKVAAGIALLAALMGIGFSAEILEKGQLRTETKFVATDRGLGFAHLSWKAPPWIPAMGITLGVILGLPAAYGLWQPRRAALLVTCAALIACGAILCGISGLIQVKGDVPPELVGDVFAVMLTPGIIGIAMIITGVHLLRRQAALSKVVKQTKDGPQALKRPLRYRDDPFPLIAPLAEDGPKDFANVVMNPTRCRQCGNVGAPIRFFQHPIQISILVVLLMLWVVPGLLYLRARRNLYVCRQCRQPVAREQLAYGQVAVT